MMLARTAFGRPLLATALSVSLLWLGTWSCAPETQPLNTPRWLSRAMDKAPGEAFTLSYEDEAATHTLHALGFARLGEGHYQRRVDLLSRSDMWPSAMEALPEIDAIAIISIHRPALGAKQYIYPTLRSTLAQLPCGAQINVLVGNNDAAYLSAQILAEELGPQDAERVHVLPTGPDVAQFFDDEHIATSSRAAWNYARALRSYRGSSHLLLLEDDVSMSEGALLALRPYLQHDAAPIVTLFNDRCSSVATTLDLPESPLSLGHRIIEKNSDFPTTQAFIFSHHVASEAGDYIVSRAGRESYDYMLGRFFAQTRSALGYVFPSVVQHEGRQTTGLSGPGAGPLSRCFEPHLWR